MIVSKAKLAIFEESVCRSLLKIDNCYCHLSSLIIKVKSAKYTIENAIKDSETMDFGNDPSNLSKYFKTRLENNEILKINAMQNNNISPETYSSLLKCQSTSASVERSFSMLSKFQP